MEPIANGVDYRGSNIALLESRYEYENWMKALVKVHQDSGLKFQSQDPLKAMLASDSVFVQGLFSVNLQGMDAEGIRRRLAFSAGFQYMEQLTGNNAPAALRTGFDPYNSNAPKTSPAAPGSARPEEKQEKEEKDEKPGFFRRLFGRG